MADPARNSPLKPLGVDVPQRLIAAALELLQSQGFQALTQAKVAEAAGVRQSHLTYYFRTRNDLLKAVVEEGSVAMLMMMEGENASGKVALAKFRELLVSRHSDQSMPRLMVALTVASDEDPTLKVWLQEFDRGFQTRLAHMLKQLGLTTSPDSLALFHATMVGAAVLNLQRNGTESSLAAAKTIRLAFDRLVADSRVSPHVRTKVQNT